MLCACLHEQVFEETIFDIFWVFTSDAKASKCIAQNHPLETTRILPSSVLSCKFGEKYKIHINRKILKTFLISNFILDQKTSKQGNINAVVSPL